MAVVAKRKQPIMVRPDPQLHELVVAASQAYPSMNQWAIQAFREKLARQSKGQDKPLPFPEPHHEDPRDAFERIWARALIRHLRNPGKSRSILDHLAEFWNLPELPKPKR